MKEPAGLGSVAATDLIGREADLGLLAEFLRRAASHGGSLIIAGAPGLGKSALLHAAAATAAAHGVKVVRATGIEFSVDISFFSLRALLEPLAGHLDDLQPLQQQTIVSMLGHEPDANSDVLMRNKAVLELLRLAAAERPLLLVVDDLHWVDRTSAALLGFVARRLDGTRVGLLGAFRTGNDTFFGRDGLPAHELQPLVEPAAAALVATRYPTLGVRATRRVLAEAQGNPLALIELPQALAASVARDPVPSTAAVMPLSRRLHDLYAGRVQALPDATRRLLLLAALEGTGDVLVMTQAGGSAGLADLAPAEAAGLVVVDPDGRRLSFRYPLIRSTVVQGASAEQLRSSHRALAGVLEADTIRRAHHLAQAAEGPDEAVAELLERSADEALRRGDAIGAFVTLLSAADLSTSAAERGRRLAAAAYVGADVAGELRSAADLLVEARRADPSLRGSLRAAVAAGHVLLNVDGHIDLAHRLLAGALQGDAAAPGDDSDGREEALLLLLELCLFAGRPDLWQSCRPCSRGSQALYPRTCMHSQTWSPTRPASRPSTSASWSMPARGCTRSPTLESSSR
jgi:hypothetical protein